MGDLGIRDLSCRLLQEELTPCYAKISGATVILCLLWNFGDFYTTQNPAYFKRPLNVLKSLSGEGSYEPVARSCGGSRGWLAAWLPLSGHVQKIY